MQEVDEPSAETVPRTYLLLGLLATILCFLPTGLVALYFGIRVNKALADGRRDDANRASIVARRWLVVTAVIGLLIYAVLGSTFALLGAFAK